MPVDPDLAKTLRTLLERQRIASLGTLRAASRRRFHRSRERFALFAIRPRSLRLVGGFAQAKTLTPEGFARALSAAS